MRRPPSLLAQMLLSACIAAALPACTQPATSVEATPGASTPTAITPDAVAETPEQAARRLYAASRTGDFGSTRLDTMAPPLRALVERDNACVAQAAGTCEIDSDPWLQGGGQEGGIEGPPRFETLSTAPLEARLRMDYTYAWDDGNKEAQSTCVLLARHAPDATWQLTDLERACDGSSSLLAMLRQAYPDTGTP